MTHLLLILLAGIAGAAQPETWYPARVVRVIDGDTIAMAVEIWPGLTQQATVRVYHIDTPELRASQQCEKQLAAKATQFTRDFLADSQIWIRPQAFDTFGRALADVQAGGKDLGQALTDAGRARPYREEVDGGWCGGDIR